MPNTLANQCCIAAQQRLGTHHASSARIVPDQIPTGVLGTFPAHAATQETFGRLLLRLADLPNIGPRIVTTSPDVSVSTNLAGWINKVDVFAPDDVVTYEDESKPRLLKWRASPSGQHIELGISETNLFMLLSQLGLAHELCDQLLFPTGTVYDPFICRGLDALIYGLYSGSRFIFVGTPSGITLSSEGGAHQSTVAPPLGIALPQLRMYEPCFAVEVEWMMLEALRQCCDRVNGRSVYLRLSTRVVDQGLIGSALQRMGQTTLYQFVLLGGYRIVEGREECPPDTRCAVYIVASGAVVPEAVEAAYFLQSEGVAATVLNLTSADRLLHDRCAAGSTGSHHLSVLIPPVDRHLPIVTLQDGSAHTLAWPGSVVWHAGLSDRR
jgi:pyruvate dehydrogenase E1 component